MTVICPACDARFRDPPQEIVVKARPLQCSACDHEWTPVSETTGRMIVAAPSMDPTMEDLMDTACRDRNLPVIAEERPEPIFVDSLPPEAIPSAPWPKTALAGLCLLMVGVLGVGLKDTIVENVPQSAQVYRAAGLLSDHPGLKIARVTTVKETRDGIRKLIVRGEIENVASGPVPVPSLDLVMLGEGSDKLYQWTVTASASQLGAGEKGRFTAVAHGFPEGVRDVKVSFTPPK
ncbi:zinc finger-domain-containing protein [Ahrensia sp. R2A130]|uniref:zinc finger-domain-containing protein n=1 Tax=Ahrensia sp. R2A130 TaxID=744979 RepID=UPI0001E0E8F1|nr:zinc finger-domain-containing protein [Ahrensia sp. R2A130]EFL88011.1 putative zinc finger-domain-containing protein [Ahrensia sp. R2A130]